MKLLLATDGSSFSHAASDMLLRLRLPKGTEVVVLHVHEVRTHVTSTPQHLDELREHVIAERAHAERVLTAEVRRLTATGLRASTVIEDGNVANAILDTARARGCDTILIGSHGRGALARFVLGSVSHSVVYHADCSVLIARPRGGVGLHPPADGGAGRRFQVVLAYDDSPTSRAVVDQIAGAPWFADLDLTLVAVLDILNVFRMDLVEVEAAEFGELERRTREGLDAAAAKLQRPGCAVSTVLVTSSRPHHEILRVAGNLDADLIVVGDKGASALKRFLTGSVAHRVVNHAHTSVLVVRPPATG